MSNTIELLYLNKQNKKKSDQKTLRLQDTREGTQMINIHIKRWLMPYFVKEIQTRYPLAHRIECSQNFRTLIGPRMGKDVAHHKFSFTAGRSKNYCNHFGRQLGSLLHMTQQPRCCCLPHRVGNLHSFKAFTWVFMAPFHN